MMTARDDAINAIQQALPNTAGVASVIDAIPPGVLARLAIERGALEPTGTSHCVSSETKGDRIYNNLVPVYYVAEATQ